MKTHKIALATLAIVSLALSGCAGMGSQGAAEKSSDKADGPVTVDFWSNHPGSSKEIEKRLLLILKQLIQISK
ncbi:hypothetical protein [Arcanobacterium hippocoleae]|uniref:hypothetical protein n=1 Tax=Arcanobacterium hippocoleae TaxID=149017 RepID=UPI00334203AB